MKIFEKLFPDLYGYKPDFYKISREDRVFSDRQDKSQQQSKMLFQFLFRINYILLFGSHILKITFFGAPNTAWQPG